MKVMISQPMKGLSEEQIKEVREHAIKEIESQGHEFVNTFFEDEFATPENLKASGYHQIPVWFLGKSLQEMAKCDGVYFCAGWQNNRGCRIEHEVAKEYGLTRLYEDVIE